MRLAAFRTGLILLLLVVSRSYAAPQGDVEREDEPIWQSFVVGKVKDLPDGPIKEFLTDTHFNNPYASTIAELTKKLGPFAPEADNVFWIPTLEVPVTPEYWRFLSSIDDIPKSVLNLTTLTKEGQVYVRMFLHPYSTEEPLFVDLARRLGGFKYEFQGATTGSVRSLIAWKTAPKPENGSGALQPPTHPNAYLQPKVSITRMDIDGSRLQPAKKMVRAYAVTREMSQISRATKKKIGFDFAGEWLVGVPSGSDAGFVTREILPPFLGKNGMKVEPGFSMFSPKRLTEVVGNAKFADVVVRDKLLRPVVRPIAYLLMEEGMFGEYHEQNFNYVETADGNPVSVLFHDADSFRASIGLRAIEGKSTAVLRGVDAPFFFSKDAVFDSSADDSDYGIKSLIDTYFADPKQSDSVAGFIKAWCSKIPAYKSWCNNRALSKMFQDVFSQELEPYVGHPIENLDIAGNMSTKAVGLGDLFREHMDKVANESDFYRSEPDPKIQQLLADEFERLRATGRGKAYSSSITTDNTNFLLDLRGGNATIHAISKNPGRGKLLKGVALVGLSDDPASVDFASKIKSTAGIEIPMDTVSGFENGMLARPWMHSLGGGSNIPASVREYLSEKDARYGVTVDTQVRPLSTCEQLLVP